MSDLNDYQDENRADLPLVWYQVKDHNIYYSAHHNACVANKSDEGWLSFLIHVEHGHLRE